MFAAGVLRACAVADQRVPLDQAPAAYTEVVGLLESLCVQDQCRGQVYFVAPRLSGLPDPALRPLMARLRLSVVEYDPVVGEAYVSGADLRGALVYRTPTPTPAQAVARARRQAFMARPQSRMPPQTLSPLGGGWFRPSDPPRYGSFVGAA